jgi:hypothetical protein
MNLFKHKPSISELIQAIPEEEIIRIAGKTKVDRYSKVLSGKLMFYLLLYGMLCVDRLSQRGLRDAFSPPLFRSMFNYRGKKGISHSSISDRLAVLNVDFFKRVYECMYHKLSQLYSEEAIAGMRLQRVDSTLVKESSNKLREGLTCGNEYKKGKMLKYTINFDGMFATMGSVHKEACYASESLALPENVMNRFKKENDHSIVYLFDRGQRSGEAFAEMKNEEGVRFVGRLMENRRLNVIKEFACRKEKFTCGELVEDKVVQLYKTVHEKGKNGKDIVYDNDYRHVGYDL